MGRRVNFYRGTADGALTLIVNAPLGAFQQWYVKQISDVDERLVETDVALVPIIQDIVEKKADGFLPHNQEHARLIDRATDLFYTWCSCENSDILAEASGSTFYYSRYEKALPEIKHYLGPEAARLWEYLLKGRPVGRPDVPYPYVPSEKDYPCSHWTAEEVRFLFERLNRCRSPRTTQIRNAFWNTFTYGNSIPVEAAFEAIHNARSEGQGLVILVV